MDDYSHRPPVLLQSADDHDHHHYSDRSGSHSLRHSSQPLTSLLHPPDNVIPYPGHVHTKDCRDVCPDQDLYTETAYIRFDKGMRTNIYGLTVVEELGETAKKPGQPTSTGIHSPPTEAAAAIGTLDSKQSPDQQTTPPADTSGPMPTIAKSIFTDRVGRYVLVASSGLVTCYVGMEHSFEIPLGSNQEIVSIDAYESACQGGYRVVMSIAIARAEESGTQFEILFYGAQTCAKTVIDHILSFPCTSDIQRIPVNWAPTKILHVPLTMDLSKMAILVGGGDTKVHSFIKDNSGCITEQPIEDYFPVLTTFHHSQNCILSMDVRDYPAFRVIAAGTQNGTLNVAIIPRNRATYELQHDEVRTHSVILFSPITSLAIYTSRVRAVDAQRKTLRHGRHDTPVDATLVENAQPDTCGEVDQEEDVHLLLTCAIEQAWVYTAINRNGLAKRSELTACGHHDSILTSYVMDIDWDGENELVIGTYGRQLMVFKQIHNYFVHPASSSPDATLRYELYWNRRFAYPVYGISSADVNNDGLEELVTTTMYGISFFQPDTIAAKRRLTRAINKMSEIERIKLRLERLRAENLQLENEAEEQLIRIQAEEQAEAEEAEERAKAQEESIQAETPQEAAVQPEALSTKDTEVDEKEAGAPNEELEELASQTEEVKDDDGHESFGSDKASEDLGKGLLEPHSCTNELSPVSSTGHREGSVAHSESSEEADPSSEVDVDESSDESDPKFKVNL